MGRAHVVFTRLAAGGYAVHALRPGGATVHMPTSDRKFRVPHDLAHFAVERELDLADGVFGTVMAGGLFDKMRVVAGRRRHDDRARGAAVVRANSVTRALAVAEVLAGVVHHAVETGDRGDLFAAAREEWGITRADPFPYDRAQVEAARSRLADLGGRWNAVPPGGELVLPWTVRTPTIRRHDRPRQRR